MTSLLVTIISLISDSNVYQRQKYVIRSDDILIYGKNHWVIPYSFPRNAFSVLCWDGLRCGLLVPPLQKSFTKRHTDGCGDLVAAPDSKQGDIPLTVMHTDTHNQGNKQEDHEHSVQSQNYVTGISGTW